MSFNIQGAQSQTKPINISKLTIKLGIKGYTPFYTQQIISKDLLYSTGSHIQCLVTTHNGKDHEYILIITESLCCTPETNMTL